MEILLDNQNKICIKDKYFNTNKARFEESKIVNNRLAYCFRDNKGLVMIKEQGFNFEDLILKVKQDATLQKYKRKNKNTKRT